MLLESYKEHSIHTFSTLTISKRKKISFPKRTSPLIPNIIILQHINTNRHISLTPINHLRKTTTEMIITPIKHVHKRLADLLHANTRLCPVHQESVHLDFVFEVPVDVVLPVCGALCTALAGCFVYGKLSVVVDVPTLVGGVAVEPDCVFEFIPFPEVLVRVGI